MAGISFLILVVLFLISVYFSQTDYSLLFLGIGTIFLCIRSLFATGAVECPQSLDWLVNTLMPLLPAPCILAFAIINRKKQTYKYFLIIVGVVLLLITSARVLNNFWENAPNFVVDLQLFEEYLYNRSFDKALHIALVYLVVICVIASLVYHIRNLLKIYSEKTALEERTRAVQSGYESMVEGVRNTSALRHEWKHDLLTLSLLYEQGKTEEIGKYLHEKNDFIKNNELESLSGNFVFDVIISSVSARAKAENVDFKARVKVPPELKVREEDLCQLIMNMLENAFNACAKIKGDKYIEFDAELKQGYLLVKCSNSFPAEDYDTSEPEGFKKGYGFKNMEKVCEAYGSELIADVTKDGVFTVKTALQLSRAEV